MDPRFVYERLLAHFGPQRWWPAQTRFEVVVGALLMAQTTWRNVEAAIANLRRAGLLEPHAIAAAPVSRIRSLVKPAGLYRTKPRWLKAFCRHLMRVADGDLGRFFGRGRQAIRQELLSLDGVGPETADSILLYSARLPTFVVDAYTVRIGRRLGLFDTDGYDEVKAYFESRLSPDVDRFREFHALLVAHGKQICRPRPRCEACPLNGECAYYRKRRG